MMLDTRSVYAYPPSPTSPTFPEQSRNLSTRMRMLQDELSALEAELADPSNPLLSMDAEGDRIDAGELIKNLVDVRSRLDKVKKGRDIRLKLIDVAAGKESKPSTENGHAEPSTPTRDAPAKPDTSSSTVAGMDKRVGALEALLGSSNMSIDEVQSFFISLIILMHSIVQTSPLPAPLVPMLTRLNTQLTLLTQPRQLDSISRRLKLLLSDLDRMPTSHSHQNNHRRQPSHNTPASPVVASSALQEQIAPLLSRVAPNLAHIPHILARLRTLSALHNSAAEFQSTLDGLEDEQRRVRTALDDLRSAIESVEMSFEDNGKVVKSNISGLEERVELMLKRIEQLS